MEAWRRVEVGRRGGALRARRRGARRDPRRHLHRGGRPRARAGHRPRRRPRSSTCWRTSAGQAGRWIHFGLTSSDVLDTALALQLRPRGRDRGRRRARARRARCATALASTRTRSASAAPTGSTPSPTTFGLKLAGFAFEAAPQPAPARARVRAGRGGRASRARWAPTPPRPGLRARVLGPAGPGAPSRCPPRWSPRDRHAELLQAIALAGRRARAPGHRDPPPPAHRGARGGGAVPRRPEGLDRHAPQAQPDRQPSASPAWPGSCAATRRRGGRERGALARARHLPLVGAERVMLPDATILLDYMQHLAIRVVRELRVYPERMRENLELTHGALFSQRVAAGAGGVGHGARRRLPDRPGDRPARVGRAHARCATCWPPTSRCPPWTSTRSSTRPSTSATWTRSWRGSTRSSEAQPRRPRAPPPPLLSSRPT